MNIRKYDSLDIMKYVLALMVIALHTGMPREINSSLYEFLAANIYRCGVPFFFIASGFMFAKGNRGSEYSKKLLKPLLVFGLGYFFIDTSIQYLRSGGSTLDFILNKFQTMIISGPPGAMWYLYVLLLSSLIINFCKKLKINLYIVSIIWIILFVIEFKFNIRYGAYVAIGYLLYRNIYIFEKLKPRICIPILILVFALSLFTDFDMAVNSFQMIFDVILYILVVGGIKINILNRNIPYYARKMSTVMYYTHMLFVYGFQCVLYLINIKFDEINSLLFLIVVVITNILGMVYLKFQNRLPAFLKNLF